MSDDANHGFLHVGDGIYSQTLSNGLQLAVMDRPEDENIRIEVIVESGCAEDPAHRRGVAHFLEHCLFPPNIDKEFRLRGGWNGAATNGGQINVYGNVKATEENAAFLITFLDYAMSGSVDPNQFEIEKSRILSEWGMHKDVAGSAFRDILDHAFRDQRGVLAGENNLGTQEDITAMTIGDLQAYRDAHFVGENIKIAVTNVAHDSGFAQNLVRMLEKLPPSLRQNRNQIEINRSDIRVENDHIHQAYFAFAFARKALTLDNLFTDDIAGDYLNGLIKDKLQEEQGICYMVDLFSYGLANRNFPFIVNGNARPERLVQLVPALCDTIRDSIHTINIEELQAAKDAKLRRIKAAERDFDSGAKADYIVQDMTFGHIMTAQQRLDAVNAVTTQDVQNYLMDIVYGAPPTIVAYGPDLSGLHSYDEFLDMLYKGRDDRPDIEPARDIYL